MNEQPINPSSERPEDSPGYLTWQISMCWQRKVNQELAEFGITYTQFILLAVIHLLKKRQQAVHQHQVATLARIDRMMTSRVIGNLERKKLLMRSKLSGDGRTNMITLTENGERVIAAAQKKVKLLEKDFFSAGTNKEKEIIGYLQQILPEC